MSPFGYRFSKWWCRVALRLLFRASWRGAPFPATGPVVVVANHTSFLDPPLTGSGCPRPIRFLARDTLAKIPLLGRWMRWVGVVLVDRAAPTATTLGILIGILREGGVVLVFPEGTRSRSGEIGEFKRGVLLLLKQTDAVVVPAGVRGTFRAFPPNARFPRLFRKVSVVWGEPVPGAEVRAAGGLERLRATIGELAGLPLAGSGESRTPARSE